MRLIDADLLIKKLQKDCKGCELFIKEQSDCKLNIDHDIPAGCYSNYLIKAVKDSPTVNQNFLYHS